MKLKGWSPRDLKLRAYHRARGQVYVRAYTRRWPMGSEGWWKAHRHKKEFKQEYLRLKMQEQKVMEATPS